MILPLICTLYKGRQSKAKLFFYGFDHKFQVGSGSPIFLLLMSAALEMLCLQLSLQPCRLFREAASNGALTLLAVSQAASWSTHLPEQSADVNGRQ